MNALCLRPKLRSSCVCIISSSSRERVVGKEGRSSTKVTQAVGGRGRIRTWDLHGSQSTCHLRVMSYNNRHLPER